MLVIKTDSSAHMISISPSSGIVSVIGGVIGDDLNAERRRTIYKSIFSKWGYLIFNVIIPQMGAWKMISSGVVDKRTPQNLLTVKGGGLMQV